MLTTRPLLAGASGVAVATLFLCAACSSGDPATPNTQDAFASGPAAAMRTGQAPSATTGPSSTPRPAASAPAPASEQPVDEACVQAAFDELTASQRAGQLVMVGIPIGAPAKERTLVRKQHVGSVFLAGRTSHAPSTIKKGVATLAAQRTRTTTIRLLVSVDQEGGKVQSLRGKSWTSIPAATVQGRWSRSMLTTRTQAWVKQLTKAGVNMDLAPVADTVPAGTARRNPPVGVFGRQYGSTPAAVAEAVTTVTAAMKAGSLIPTVKHFPGLGRVRFNTDTSAKAVDPTTTMTSADLEPFQAGIDAGAGAVMISSARYPKIDKAQPAVFSAAVITELLRNRMQYQGVVMTDDVGRAAAMKSVPAGRRATRFIAAGGDLVLTVVPAHAATMIDAIVAEAARTSTFRVKANAATLRVLRLKERSGLLTCS